MIKIDMKTTAKMVFATALSAIFSVTALAESNANSDANINLESRSKDLTTKLKLAYSLKTDLMNENGKGMSIRPIEDHTVEESQNRSLSTGRGVYLGVGIGATSNFSTSKGSSTTVELRATPIHRFVVWIADPFSVSDLSGIHNVCPGAHRPNKYNDKYEVAEEDLSTVVEVNNTTLESEIKKGIQRCIDAGNCISPEGLQALEERRKNIGKLIADITTDILDFNTSVASSDKGVKWKAFLAQFNSDFETFKYWAQHSKIYRVPRSFKILAKANLTPGWTSLDTNIICVATDMNILELEDSEVGITALVD